MDFSFIPGDRNCLRSGNNLRNGRKLRADWFYFIYPVCLLFHEKGFRMRALNHVRSFNLFEGKKYFRFKTPKEKHQMRKIVRELNSVFIPKKTNLEFD
jgi:hypothetical protein